MAYIPKNQSLYILKQYTSNLFRIESDQIHIEDRRDIAKDFYPLKWYFAPFPPVKSIKYYESFPEQTKSIVFNPIMDKFDPSSLTWRII